MASSGVADLGDHVHTPSAPPFQPTRADTRIGPGPRPPGSTPPGFFRHKRRASPRRYSRNQGETDRLTSLWKADLSSGMIRIRPARCGQVGHNAGTIATAGQVTDHPTRSLGYQTIRVTRRSGCAMVPGVHRAPAGR
jgi:hypothetical protein